MIADKIELDGREFSVEIEYDQDAGYPWEDDCIFDGVVSDWERRDKRPSEKILNEDRESKRFFDVKQYIKVAKSHGCTAKQATEQCETSFEYLRRYCSDQWNYVFVTVTLLDEDGEKTDFQQCLGGIESDNDGYLNATSMELARDCLCHFNETAYREAQVFNTVSAALFPQVTA